MEGLVNATVALLPPAVSSLLASTLLSAHPIHLGAELLLLLFVVYLLFAHQSKAKPLDAPLTPQEEEQLLSEWQPEPLLLASTSASSAKAASLPRVPVLESSAGALVRVQGVRESAINLAGTGVLGYQCHARVVEAALECANSFGIGACGPRGFYGSITPHMDLEKRVATFLRVEDSVMFSAEFQAGASVIPAFAKPGDIVVADKGVHFALQNGLQLSRAEVRWFEHTSVADLQRVLESLTDVFRAQRQRVFVVLEGLSQQSGKLFALDAVMRLKERFPFRIILDDSLAIGTLGATGRGSCEHFGVDPRQVELILFSLGHAIGSVGGMACASGMLCEHMRLNCTGYVFSCSSPPYIAQAAITSLDLLDEGRELPALRRAVATAHASVSSLAPRLSCDSDALSPYLYLRLGPKYTVNAAEERRLLAAISDAALGPIVVEEVQAQAEERPKTRTARTPSKAKAKETKETAPLKESKEAKDTAPDAQAATKRGRPRRASAGAGASASALELVSVPPSAPVLVCVTQFAPQERFAPRPVLRVSVSALLDDASIRSALATLDRAARTVLK